ncbi:MAG: nuclear transport factor 2 family protein [Bacteroidetes bacterium]|nr:nuclear transport factor 2 family protein [Bacteroidota bacterium]
MRLSDKDIARIKADVETVVRSLHAAHLARGEGTLEHFLAFFEEDVIGVGTGLDEVVYNKKDLTTLLEREWGETPQSLHYVLHSVEVRVLSAESASAQSFVDIYLGEPDGPSLFARLTTVFRNVGGEWRSVHWHASTPWEIQPEGVSWPTDELEARARKLQEQVDARTLELAKANRELEIDAALERIRRVTGEMKDASDLIEVVKQIKVEVDSLFGSVIVEVGLVQEVDDETIRFWSIIDVNEVPEDLAQFGLLYPKKPDPTHPMVDRVWAVEEGYASLFFDLDAMWQIHRSLAHYNPPEADLLKAALDGGMESGWVTVFAVQVGRMYLSWSAEPPGEVAAVQPRIAAVLTEAQQRVEELRQAQHMAREAEINLAVEKVRARASGMQTSGEIVDVADVLREQMVGLGLSDVVTATVYTRTVDGQHRVSEMARLEEESSEFSFDWIFNPDDLDPKVMVHDFLAAKEATVFHEDAEAMALLMKEALKYDPDYTEDYQQAMDEGGISEMWVAVCPAVSIRLCIDFTSEPPEEILTILPRMAQAFDHAYRRHQDLERAEAQTREAQVEAALERIRSRTIGMQSSDELAEVSLVLDKEIRGLGTKTWGCAFNIYGEAELQSPLLSLFCSR